MKAFIKLIPVAAAALALVSCNNEDFFGDASQNAKRTMEVTVEAGSTTRANYYYDGEADRVFFTVGDKLRAYDAAIQKYDEFELKEGQEFFTTETEYVATHAKAIYPAENVSYGGWIPGEDGGTLTALVHMPAAMAYSKASQSTVNGYPAFTSTLPMWGDVDESAGHLTANLRFLTSYIVLTVNNGAGKFDKIIVESQKANGDPNDAMPLTGYFDAELKTNGQLKKSTNPAITAGYNAAAATLTINVESSNLAYNSDLYIPIIPGTYPKLKVSYKKGEDAAVEVKTWENKEFKRGSGKTAKYTFAAEAKFSGEILPYDITEVLNQYKDAGSDVTVDIMMNKGTATPASPVNTALVTEDKSSSVYHTITIPSDMKSNLTVNFVSYGDGTGTAVITPAAAKALRIVGGNPAKKVTFNFGTIEISTGDLEIETDCPFELQGTTTTNVTVKKTAGLTLSDFTANTAGKTVTVESGEVTVGKNEHPATVKSLVTFANTTIDNPATTISTLTLSKGCTEVNLNNGVIETLDYNGTAEKKIAANVTVTSKGISAIGTHTTTNINSKTTTFKSSLTATPADIKTAFATEAAAKINATTGNIFTAAQLAVVDGTAAKYILEANITGFEKPWVPVALSKAFDGNGKTITGLNNSLFGAISAAVTVEKLTLANPTVAVANSEEAGLGALAQKVTAGATLSKIGVTGATLGVDAGVATESSNNIGGLVGFFKPAAAAELTINDCYVTGTIKGYHNMGGFIGLVKGDAGKAPTVTINNTAALATKSAVSFVKTLEINTARNNKYGRVGTFIGSLDGTNVAPVVTIGGNAAYNNAYAQFATSTIDASSLKFDRNNWDANVGGKDGVCTYKGMSFKNYEIGYSIVTNMGDITLYNVDNVGSSDITNAGGVKIVKNTKFKALLQYASFAENAE